MVAKSPLLGILAVTVLIGSVVAPPTLLLQQQASAFIIEGGKDFKKLTKQFQRDVLT